MKHGGATSRQLRALLDSYAKGDDDRFLSVAAQMASSVARNGDERLSKDILRLVDCARTRESHQVEKRSLPFAAAPKELANLVSGTFPGTRFAEMVLPVSVATQLKRVLDEYRHSNDLQAFGLTPRRKLLLVGPPGCGKTMTAAALAGELNLPLMVVQFHSLITRFMGETSAKLWAIFEVMAKRRAVYLFDEFDAIGADRSRPNDVGESRRILNSFLMMLEQDDSQSVIVAATNLVGVLDTALFRRFDDVVYYAPPDDAEIERLVKNRLAMFKVALLDWPKVIRAGRGLSHADVVRSCEDAAKQAVLEGDCEFIESQALEDALTAKKRGAQ